MQMKFFHLNVVRCSCEWICEQVAAWFQWKIAQNECDRIKTTQCGYFAWRCSVNFVHIEVDRTLSALTCFCNFFLLSLATFVAVVIVVVVECLQWVWEDWKQQVCGWLWHQLDDISRHILWITFICSTLYIHSSLEQPIYVVHSCRIRPQKIAFFSIARKKWLTFFAYSF